HKETDWVAQLKAESKSPSPGAEPASQAPFGRALRPVAAVLTAGTLCVATVQKIAAEEEWRWKCATDQDTSDSYRRYLSDHFESTRSYHDLPEALLQAGGF